MCVVEGEGWEISRVCSYTCTCTYTCDANRVSCVFLDVFDCMGPLSLTPADHVLGGAGDCQGGEPQAKGRRVVSVHQNSKGT